jgi:DNA-binding NtrC family response regulator/ligand-binding sensor domain-containing protein
MDHEAHMTLLPFAQRGAWRRYTTADGLAANQTEHLVEDREGYLWIATATGGLSRFDGDEFHTYTTRDGLPADGVYALLVDRRGQLWCGTERGLCRFDGERFHPLEGEGCAAGEGITFLFEDHRGWVWLKGFKVCGYWDGERYGDLAPCIKALTGREFSSCWGICEDETGAIWMGGSRHTIRWTDGVVETIALPQGPQKEQGWEPCLAAHPGGGIWHSDGNHLGIWREGGYTAVEVEFGGFVRKILPDRQGRTWFCLSGRDLAALVCEEGCFRGLRAQEIGFSTVCGFHEDREGGLWFATWGGGLSRFDPAGPFTLGVADSLPSLHTARIAQDQGHRLWVSFADLYLSGTMAGYLQDGHFCVVEDTQHCAGGLLTRADGSVWLAGGWGLRQWREGQRAPETLVETDAIRPAPGGRTFTCLAEEEESLLGWLAGLEPHQELGISRFDGTALQEVFSMPVPESMCAIVGLAPTSEGLWFGVGPYYGQGPGYGLGFLSAGGEVRWYLPADGLVHASVQALHLDRAGHLWVATLGGLSRFDGRAFTNYTIENGLPHNHVRSIAEDEGGLWFGTDAGVVRFDGETFQLVRLGIGSPIRSMARDHAGQWWFATMEGLVGYRPSRIPPRVRIAQTVAEQTWRGAEALEVTTAARQVMFEYRGMSFRTRAADLLYRCRLLGHEDHWRPATRLRRAFYRDLPPGDYTFEVCAIDRDLNESAPAQARLRVVPDERDQRIDELASLAEALGASGAGGRFVGESQALRQTLAKLRQVAPTEATVLILGETGTGKGLAARALHAQSPRKAGPFVTVSCGSLPAGLVESELFGHEKGAFTGALRRKLGKVELARQGTLFLDEVGDLPLEAQAKLLRLLEEGTFERVGGTEERPCEVRVVAATNRDLEQMVAAGTFRADLFYRLHVVPVRLPSLWERREDIPMLAAFFAERMAAHLNKPITQLEPAALERLKRYDWPGNVRELEHAMQRAVIVCPGQVIRAADIALEAEGRGEGRVRECATLEAHERRHIRQVLEQTGWVIAGPEGAASFLGVPESTLRYRMRKLGIARP